MPRFSIVIPVFNASDTLAETIEAIRAQTCTDWEAILVDDGSTDGSRDLLDGLAADPRFRPMRNPGKGPSAARNHGVSKARGEIIAFCDADDLWDREKLARVAAMFAQADLSAVFGRVAFYPTGTQMPLRLSTVPRSALTIPMLLAENPVCTMSNLSIRTLAFRACGGFDEGMVHNEDLDLLVRLVAGGATIAGDSALHLLYRTDARGLSSSLAKMRAGRQEVLRRAAALGHIPENGHEAVFLRYLTRRALRMDDGAGAAFRFAVQGLFTAPRAFLTPARRGVPTAGAALVAPLLPKRLRRALFAA
ncbi:MAG: glycosyltransferase family 2 protein [Pseudomonadota bacterium]|nr:glycosyltransferase family 2 protein [Pseudomonadota bacterium]